MPKEAGKTQTFTFHIFVPTFFSESTTRSQPISVVFTKLFFTKARYFCQHLLDSIFLWIVNKDRHDICAFWTYMCRIKKNCICAYWNCAGWKRTAGGHFGVMRGCLHVIRRWFLGPWLISRPARPSFVLISVRSTFIKPDITRSILARTMNASLKTKGPHFLLRSWIQN